MVLLIAAGLFASLPWLLSTSAGNRIIAPRISEAFAPGRVRIGSIRLSWAGATRLRDITLDDPAGKTVVTAPSGSLSSSLWGLIVHPDRPGTLALEDAAFSIERHEDGAIDLAEALSGIFAGRDPLRDLTIRADGASVQYRAPALARPIAAESMDLLVQLRPSPALDTWTIELRQAAGPRLHIGGEFDRWRTRPTSQTVADIDLNVTLSHWPVATRGAGMELAATLDGDFSIHRQDGVWRSGGSVRSGGLEATGEAFRGDTFALADLAAEWSIAVGKDGWSIDRLEARSNLARVSAILPDLADATRPGRIEGEADLASLARQLPRALGLGDGTLIKEGKARLLATSKPGGDRSEWTVDARLSDLAWSGTDGVVGREPSPVALTGRATYQLEGRRLDVAELALVTRYGSARASGRLEGLDGPLVLDLAGTIDPDWAGLAKILAEQVDPRAKLAGKPAPFHLKVARERPNGSTSLAADLGVDLTEADLFGMRLGPAPVVGHYRDGKLAIDPIESRINGGRLRLEPVVDLEARGGPVVRLGKESSLTDATVNEEVSRRVLSYVAPVLDQTTRASGRVSASIEEATFPVGGDRNRRSNVTGKVVFQDVEFAPSPLTCEVIAMVAPRKEPGIVRLDQPVLLTIADGRVNQRGLAIPIGDLTRIEIDGWVGFNKDLSLTATLPVTPAMLSKTPLLGEILAGTKVRVPIGGTLGAPRIDKEAFNAELKELGKALLVRGAGVGAVELLNRLARPRDPNAPPPPTAEERKALRIEKRNERRRARGLDPLPMPGDRP